MFNQKELKELLRAYAHWVGYVCSGSLKDDKLYKKLQKYAKK